MTAPGSTGDGWPVRLQNSAIAAAMLLGFYAVFQFKRQIPFTLAATLAGFIAGHFLARAVAYGRMGALLKQAAIRLRAQPGHLDGAGGFKPVGDLFFYQALVIGLAAAFLAIWWLIIPFLPEYARWREIYLGLLAIALLFEMLAFFGPMWSFHTEMRAQKARLTAPAAG